MNCCHVFINTINLQYVLLTVSGPKLELFVRVQREEYFKVFELERLVHMVQCGHTDTDWFQSEAPNAFNCISTGLHPLHLDAIVFAECREGDNSRSAKIQQQNPIHMFSLLTSCSRKVARY